VALEDRHEIELIDDPRVWRARTVADLLDLVEQMQAPTRAS
jgi:hypothetical protein